MRKVSDVIGRMQVFPATTFGLADQEHDAGSKDNVKTKSMRTKS